MKPPRTRGGKREGAGRPPDWLKSKCAALIDKHKIVEFVLRVANGKEKEPMLVKYGPHRSEIRYVAASLNNRLHAAEMLFDRGFGKPQQAVDVTSGNEPVRIIFENAASKGH